MPLALACVYHTESLLPQVRFPSRCSANFFPDFSRKQEFILSSCEHYSAGCMKLVTLILQPGAMIPSQKRVVPQQRPQGWKYSITTPSALNVLQQKSRQSFIGRICFRNGYVYLGGKWSHHMSNIHFLLCQTSLKCVMGVWGEMTYTLLTLNLAYLHRIWTVKIGDWPNSHFL